MCASVDVISSEAPAEFWKPFRGALTEPFYLFERKGLGALNAGTPFVTCVSIVFS